ncbi:DNA repair and recombination protein RAD54B isoform X2 [Monodelphis domestica]|nr:DNA repair and recombination protein RAD54B isoform X2 [Monodelphis domestica]XP_056679291.1 DNA repair and recombination protein RAD54B isoform X2 [Monodelphis domestica]XP_056679292.1 DNA repair and recombination protein RAD54B isoform X2 [Monodelphis domestica]
MRRSSAPSQLQGSLAKKPRFIPPGIIRTSNLNENEKVNELGPNITFTEGETTKNPLLHLQTDSRICNSVLSAVSSKKSAREINIGKSTGKYWPKATGEVSVDTTNTAFVAATEISESKGKEAGPGHSTKYFSVFWRKLSKKKHKKWEGDAILIVSGRSFTLKDLEGRVIGRGTAYTLKDLDNLNEGETTVIGGKEIEVMGKISSDDYNSGRCFQSSVGSSCLTTSQITQKPFSNPVKNICKSNTEEKNIDDSSNFKPRHDPYAQNSFVMPRPDKSHQWIFNKNCLPLVDVVVDPYLVHHLRPHQKEGIVFLYECVMGMRMNGRFGAILADEMGLGKTLQCISLIWTLLRQGLYGGKPIIKKTLIVTPGSLVTNWRKEFQKWLGTERIKVFTLDQAHKIEDFIISPLYSVLIISYEMLLRCLDQIKNIKFDLLICDEGHRLKNSSIKTTTALVSLSCEKRVILTGTPVQNDLQEFYALIEFVNPGILGSLSSYRKIYEEPIIISREPSATQEEKKLGEKRAAELTRLTGLFILRRTQEVINKYLPPKIESVIFCRPGILQIELYRKLLSSQAVRFCLQGILENAPHLLCIGALKKLCNHPCLLFKSLKEKENNSSSEQYEEYNFSEGLIDAYPADYNPNTFSETDSGKLQVLTKLLAAIRELSPSEKVVLVSNYTQTLNILQAVCTRHGYTCTRLDGQTPVVQRQQIVDGFNSKHSSVFVFLLSSKAGGVGLNLIGGSHLILYDIDWNPATDIQAMARVWRDGQKHSVHIYRLLTTGTIEEKIYQRQISKQGLSGAVVDLAKTSEHIQFSVEELKNLFTLHEDSDCVTHDLLDCECVEKKEHQAESLEEPSTYRSCQLGPNHQKLDSKKPLSMSQLKQWKHFSGKHQNLHDPFLERIKENVSFIFQNVTNQAPVK